MAVEPGGKDRTPIDWTGKTKYRTLSREPGASLFISDLARKFPSLSPTALRVVSETLDMSPEERAKNPITANEFTEDELVALKDTIVNVQKPRWENYLQAFEDTSTLASSPDKNKKYKEIVNKLQSGYVSYGDYPDVKGSDGILKDISPRLAMILHGLGSASGNAALTLGQFNFKKRPDGDIEVSDNYNFNPIDYVGKRESVPPQFLGVASSISDEYARFRDYASEQIPPGKGRKVKVVLPKEMFSNEEYATFGKPAPTYKAAKAKFMRDETMTNRSLKREMDAQVRADIQDRERMSTDYAQEEQGKMDIAEDYVGPALAVVTGGGLGGIRQMLGKKAIKYKPIGPQLAGKKKEYWNNAIEAVDRMEKGEALSDLQKIKKFQNIKMRDLSRVKPIVDKRNADAAEIARLEKAIKGLKKEYFKKLPKFIGRQIKDGIEGASALTSSEIMGGTVLGATATADAMRRATADTAPPQDSFSDSFSKLRDLIRRNPEAENMVKINLDSIPRREQYPLPGED